jgi:hypothetical protein
MHRRNPEIDPEDAVAVFVPSVDSSRKAAHLSHGSGADGLCGTKVEGSAKYRYHSPYSAREIAQVEKHESWFSGSTRGKTFYDVPICQECDAKLRRWLTEDVEVTEVGDA